MNKVVLFVPSLTAGGVGHYAKWVSKQFPNFAIIELTSQTNITNIKLLLELIISFLNPVKRRKLNKNLSEYDKIWIHYPLLMLIINPQKIRKINPNARIFLHYHGSSTNFRFGLFKLYELIIFKMQKKYDELIILGENDRSYYQKHNYSNKIKVIANPSKLPPKKTINQFNNNYVIISRLEKGKNILETIEIFKNNKQAKLTIYGEGKLREKVIEKIKNYENITYKGYTRNIEKAFEKQNYLVLMSNYEGMPLTFIEAASQNIPIITTNCSPLIHDIVTKETGFVLDNYQQLAAVLKMANNLKLYEKLALNIQKKASLYSQEKIKAEIKNIFEQ